MRPSRQVHRGERFDGDAGFSRVKRELLTTDLWTRPYHTGGTGIMADYTFITVWRLEAPIDAVWDAVYQSERWPPWWRSVRQVIEISKGDEDGVGNVRRYVWRSRLPYTLIFELQVTRVEPPVKLEGVSSGELAGRGAWDLSAEGAVTVVRNTWEVRTSQAWMNLLAPVARPVFAWNHAISMRDGGEGIAKLLGARLLEVSHR